VAEINALTATKAGYPGISLLDSIDLLMDRLEDDLSRGMISLRFLAQTSCLLGFLGTVMGMVTTFHTVAARGQVAPGELAGGIHEALFTTLFGLVIGILGWFFAYLIEGLGRHQIRQVEGDILAAWQSQRPS
jgi:biopolymer transport protein ExbB